MMQARALLLVLASCACRASAPAPVDVSPVVAATTAPPAWAEWKELASAAQRYRVRYRFSTDPPARGEAFTAEAYVFDRGSTTPRTDVELLVDGSMPDHGHGLAREPEVARKPDGRFVVRGWRLHMLGRWLLAFDVVDGPRIERAELELVLE